MARGWESKSIEDQQQAAEDRASAAMRVALSAERLVVDQKREGLLLQRTRILREIAGSSSERHRATLNSGLEYLDAQLADMGWKDSE